MSLYFSFFVGFVIGIIGGSLNFNKPKSSNPRVVDQSNCVAGGDIPVGVWSEDKISSRYNRETKRYEHIVYDNPLDNLARDLFELVKPLADSVINGFELTVTR